MRKLLRRDAGIQHEVVRTQTLGRLDTKQRRRNVNELPLRAGRQIRRGDSVLGFLQRRHAQACRKHFGGVLSALEEALAFQPGDGGRDLRGCVWCIDVDAGAGALRKQLLGRHDDLVPSEFLGLFEQRAEQTDEVSL